MFFLGQVSRALAGGATGPEAFTPLPRLPSNHFDGTDTGASYYTKLHHFGVSNGTPFCDFSLGINFFRSWAYTRVTKWRSPEFVLRPWRLGEP